MDSKLQAKFNKHIESVQKIALEYYEENEQILTAWKAKNTAVADEGYAERKKKLTRIQLELNQLRESVAQHREDKIPLSLFTKLFRSQLIEVRNLINTYLLEKRSQAL